MEASRVTRVFSVIVIVVSALLALGVLTFAGPCVHEDGSFSACQDSRTGIVICGIVSAVAGIVSLVAKNKAVCAAMFFVAAVGGAVAAFAPGNVLPLCSMATMHCRAVMQPFAQFSGIALAAISLIAGIRTARARS